MFVLADDLGLPSNPNSTAFDVETTRGGTPIAHRSDESRSRISIYQTRSDIGIDIVRDCERRGRRRTDFVQQTELGRQRENTSVALQPFAILCFGEAHAQIDRSRIGVIRRRSHQLIDVTSLL